jgi:hypothetical protein
VKHRRTFEDQALWRTDDAIDDTAFEQLPRGTDHHPAEPREPAAVM